MRTLNAKAFNKIANDPQVRPFLGSVGNLDFSAVVSNVNNFCFLTDCKQGGYICFNREHGVYEVHTISLPEVRGKLMHRLMVQARAFMFLETDCIELQTFVPDGQHATQLWAQLAGFREEYHRDNCFDFAGSIIGGTYMSLTYRDWVLKDRANRQAGHGSDPVAAAWIGTVYRAAGGNIGKVISYFNQYADRVGQPRLNIVSFTPLVVDFGNSLRQLNADNSFSVLKESECQPHLSEALLL